MGNTKGTMTDEHKAALALGRVEGRAVRLYLDALANRKPGKRGRKGRSAEELRAKLAETTDPMERLALRSQLRAARAKEDVSDVDFDALEMDFIKNVASYSERNGLAYADWREEGVPASVLKQGGVRR